MSWPNVREVHYWECLTCNRTFRLKESALECAGRHESVSRYYEMGGAPG